MSENDNKLVTMSPSSVPAAVPESDEWLTIEEAAALIGKSTRHIFRLGNAGLIESKLGPQPKPGAKHRVLYNKAHLLLQRDQAAPNLRRMPPGALMLETPGIASPAAFEHIRELIPEIFKHWTMAQQETQAHAHEHEHHNTPHRWLTIEEAATYCSASKGRLLRAAQSGVLVAIKDPGWKIRQSSLDAWDGTAAPPRKRKAAPAPAVKHKSRK